MPRALAIPIATCFAAPVLLLAQVTVTGTLQVQRGADLFPLADCTVFAQSAVSGPLVGEYSDDQGRFELAFPPDPQVQVGTDCPGYRLSSIDGRLSALRLYDCSKPGLCAQVELVVQPLAVIEGEVVDPNGMPVEGVRLGLRPGARPAASGRAAARPMSGRALQASSDDRGYFRLFHLPPGSYELQAISGGGPGNGIEWFAEPQRIELEPGDVVSGVRVQMRSIESVPFAGRIQGLPPGTTHVMLRYSTQRGGVQRGSGRTVQVDEQGRFRLEDMPPGEYDFEMTLPNDEGNYNDGSRIHLGTVDLTSSAGEAVLSRREPIQVSGSLEVQWPERDDLPVPPKDAPLFINLEREDGYRVGARAAPPDYRFQIPGLRAGRYTFRVSGPTAQVERRSSDGEWEPLQEIAVAEGDSLELDLRVRYSIGRLTVAVRPEGKPYVVGIRKDGITRLFPTDPNGRLVLDYFSSGDYQIRAWEDIDPDVANDPDKWTPAGEAIRAFRHEEGVDMEITLTAAP